MNFIDKDGGIKCSEHDVFVDSVVTCDKCDEGKDAHISALEKELATVSEENKRMRGIEKAANEFVIHGMAIGGPHHRIARRSMKPFSLFLWLGFVAVVVFGFFSSRIRANESRYQSGFDEPVWKRMTFTVDSYGWRDARRDVSITLERDGFVVSRTVVTEEELKMFNDMFNEYLKVRP